jgi:hypothetical protein
MISLTGVTPAAGSNRNSKNSLIEFTLLDENNSGINTSTLIVEISGVRAIEGSSFTPGYSGEYSEINIDLNSVSIIVDPEEDLKEDSVVAVKIQIQDYSDNYYNFNYSFKIVTSAPFIFDSSPKNKDILVSPQKLFFDIRDDINPIDPSSLVVTLNGAAVYSSGVFTSPFNGPQSSFIANQNESELTIDPEEFLRDGSYELQIKLSDVSGNKLNQKIFFSVAYTGVVLPPVFPQGGFVGFYQGIKKVVDVGNGSDIELEWSTPISRFYNSDINSLIYYSADRLSTFDGLPKYFADGAITSTTLSGDFRVGTGYYFGVRAMESYKDSIDTNGMIEVSPGLYSVPDIISLTEVLSDTGAVVTVSDVSGYPDSGYLLINYEVVKYNSIDRINNKFFIPSAGRGLNDTTPSFHDVDSEVKMFLLCQDNNEVIIYGTASYQDPVSTGRQNNSIGIIVPDFSDFEKMEHDGLDHCGYHKPLPWETLNGKNDCGTYLGGEYNGFRGMNLFQRAMDREEELMENVGEKCILMRRKWQGETCSCVTLRRQHPKVRSCRFCYGTGYVGGYDQIFNLRRADQRVMIRFYEAQEDLKLGDHTHLSQEFQPTALALFKPIVKDRDIVVRFDFTGDIEYVYEVLNVSRERFVFNKYGRQKLSIIRLDKTDILYQLPFQI